MLRVDRWALRTRTTGTRAAGGVLAIAAVVLAGCSGGDSGEDAGESVRSGETQPTFSIPDQLTIPSNGTPARPIDPVPLPLSALALFSQFGNDELTGTVVSADGTLRMEAPLQDQSAVISATDARQAVPEGLMPDRGSAGALLGRVADGGPLVWVIVKSGVEPAPTPVTGETAEDQARRQAAGPGPLTVVSLVDAQSGTYLGTHYAQ